MKSPATVHLVDDDVTFVRALSQMLRAAGYEVSMHDSAAEFLSWLPGNAAGCIVADVDGSNINGLSLQSALSEIACTLPIVFLTRIGDVRTSVRMMRGGAEDVLMKISPREEILAAIESALARNVREERERARLAGLRDAFSALSPREREVLGHVVRGRVNKQIAAELGIHERTVKLHRTGITSKTGIRSSAELATRCHEARIFG